MIGSQRHSLIHDVFRRLLEAFGPQHWWPAETTLEVIVGAILTQNTAWRNVEAAISQLRQADLLSPDGILEVPEAQLKELIRSSGYYNQKSRRLKIFFEHLASRWDGNLEAFLSQPLVPLREELLGIKGIGPETADSIILYAAEQPSFVVDLYTHRVFSRHGWVPEDCDYHRLRDYFMDYLDPEVYFFQELHALLVRVGHAYCRRSPACADCPLGPLLTPDQSEIY
jgi:endonuclease-3 related protein